MERINPRLWQRLQQAADEEVRDILKRLPAELRSRAKSIPVAYEPVPGPAIVADGYDADLLGLFVGNDHAGINGDPLPSEILLFLWNIWDYAGRQTEDYREEVGRTYLHELGHYLGLEEDDLFDRDLD